MPYAKPATQAAIHAALSVPRMSTYLRAVSGDPKRALDLYGWNARASAAMMLPAHFAEVTVRNAVSDALTTLYGPDWPWNPAFERSLPSTARGHGYSPRGNLVATRNNEATTGKVIAELKFVFWQKMFTSRHDQRIWNSAILALFPHAIRIAPAALRGRIYNDLDAIRLLRNRIAHHEPIFTRNLTDDLKRIVELVDMRSADTAGWVRAMETATEVLTERPFKRLHTIDRE
ncbi:MAG TPA: hypothetical protein VJQ60_16240 [Arthrobacter sp.]|nr:hypothetical protein [Arthrobacter sp.]